MKWVKETQGNWGYELTNALAESSRWIHTTSATSSFLKDAM